jgi:hypothetical protein
LRIYQYQHTEEVIEVYTIIYSWIFPSITKVVEIEAEAVLLRSLAGSRKYSNAHVNEIFFSYNMMTIHEVYFSATYTSCSTFLLKNTFGTHGIIGRRVCQIAAMQHPGSGKRKKELALVKRLLLVIINSVNLRETKPFPILDCQPAHKRKVRHKKTSSLEKNYIGARKHPSYRS